MTAAWVGISTLPLTAQTFVNLHNLAAFSSGTNADGANPNAGLALSSGVLYGTAYNGGDFNSGAVFSLNADGSGFTKLHAFTGGSDGAGPYGQLIVSGNTLYGTGDYGGANGWGVIFKMNTDGSNFTVIYNFPSGNYSEAGLVLSGDTLYGTLYQGGSFSSGAVFAIHTNGSGYTNLHSFSGSDGASPYPAVILSGNTLYGTTYSGGTSGQGTVFAVNTDGTGFNSLHSFSGGVDGANPQSSLALSGNVLYGTTSSGGTGNGQNGVIFSVHTDGTGFTNLYDFSSSGINGDGANPLGGLVVWGKTLYGTTAGGGSGGSGTIFSMRTNGTAFTTLHNFTLANYDALHSAFTNSDGSNPYGNLALHGGVLYGTANIGGLGGNGTVFSLNILPRVNMQPSGANMLLSWLSAGPDFTVQQNLDMATTNWLVSNVSVSDNGTNSSALVNPTNASAFFRLTTTNSP
jgi:uncharacterized repeat protein (TIGR03803 family)